MDAVVQEMRDHTDPIYRSMDSVESQISLLSKQMRKSTAPSMSDINS